MSNPISLFCLIYGGPFAKAFEVELGREKTISALKELIVNKRSNYFQGINSVHLELWKVAIPVIAKDKAPQEPKLDDEDTLGPADEIGEVFPKQPLKKHVHIIIRVPSLDNIVGERSAITLPSSNKLTPTHGLTKMLGEGQSVEYIF